MLFTCVQCIKNENKKLHHSVLWLACFLIPLIPAVMGTGNYLINLEVLHNGWYSLWTQFTLFYALFFFPPLMGLYASYLWRLEHFNHNWNTFMTMPVSICNLCLGKLFILCKVAVITQLWIVFLFFLCGKYVGLPGTLPPTIVLWALRGLFASFAIGSCQLLLSMVIRSFAIPIGIALGAGILGLLLTSFHKVFGILWPYALMLTGMNANKSENVLQGMTPAFFVSAVLYFFLFFGVMIFILKKKDVRA